jgi:GNAT superfamily N-acetyltransferase
VTGTPGLIVRDAAEGDLAFMVGLLADGSLEEGKEDAANLAPYRAAFDQIAQAPGALLVAESDGRVIGVCQLLVFRHLQAQGGLCAEVESVHVHSDHRGRGIGHQLMQTAMQRAHDLGCYRLQLTSNSVRKDAHRFYESLGFLPSHQGFKVKLP